MVVKLNFGPSKVTVLDRYFGLFKITVGDRHFGPSQITVGYRNLGLSKIMVVDRNFGPSKIMINRFFQYNSCPIRVVAKSCYFLNLKRTNYSHL